MVNDYDTAVWADHHLRFSGDVRRLVSSVIEAFRRLQAIQYAAPWRRAA